jgi:hypothetical protein
MRCVLRLGGWLLGIASVRGNTGLGVCGCLGVYTRTGVCTDISYELFDDKLCVSFFRLFQAGDFDLRFLLDVSFCCSM